MIKDKEIALMQLENYIFFPGRFLGGRMGRYILVLNPSEEMWKIFLWTGKVRKKPCKVILLETSTFVFATGGFATEIKRLLSGGTMIYSTRISEDSYNEIVKRWESAKTIRNND